MNIAVMVYVIRKISDKQAQIAGLQGFWA